MLQAEAIENPGLWRLALMISAGSIHAVVTSTVEDAGMHRFTIPLDPTASRIKAIEEAVYAAPALLADYKRVDIVVETPSYTPVPSGLDDAGVNAVATICAMGGTGSDDPEILRLDPESAPAVRCLWSMDRDLDAFLARTFRNPSVVCHLTPLLSYFSRKALLGNSAKVYAHLRGGADRGMDLMVFSAAGSLLMVTSHTCPSDTDTAYFILATARQAGIDLRNDDIQLCGDPAMRDGTMPLLRRYAASVMPAIFPSAAFRAGREALKAPFPLVIIPLCE